MQAEARAVALRSVRRAEERVQVVLRMMEDGDPCEHLLGELRAVQDLLSEIVCKMLHCEALEAVNFLSNSPASLSQKEAVHWLSRIYEMLLSASMKR